MGPMISIFQKNTAVIHTSGRLAGKKSIVIDTLEDRVVVAGFIKLSKHQTFDKTRKFRKSDVFIKKMNPIHLIPSTKKFDIGFEIDTNKVFSDLKAKKEAKDLLLKTLLSYKDNPGMKWFFEKTKN